MSGTNFQIGSNRMQQSQHSKSVSRSGTANLATYPLLTYSCSGSRFPAKLPRSSRSASTAGVWVRSSRGSHRYPLVLRVYQFSMTTVLLSRFPPLPVRVGDCKASSSHSDSPTTGSANPPSAHRGVGDSIKEARETYLRDVSDQVNKLPRSKNAPSIRSRPSSFRTRQRDLKTQIRCGRPRHPEETIPATLLHPVFGQFLDDSQTHVMTKEDNDFIEELANVMSDVYDSEPERVAKVHNVFKSHDINFNLSERVVGTDYVIDGAMSVAGHRYVIAEFKNEAAACSSEPYMQCTAYYLESTKKQALQMTTSPLPCFILVLFGQFFTVITLTS
jgi:hypothetical protein